MLPLGDRVASAVIKKFDSLKPRGKPQGREWTVLAGFVVQDTRRTCCTDPTTRAGSPPCSCLRVVSLATGNKCVGNGQIPDDGSVVHDSHAEVLARRALLLRLWKELHLRAPSSIEPHQDETNESSDTPGKTSPDGHASQWQAADAELYDGALPKEEETSDKTLVLLLEPNPQAQSDGKGAWRLKPHLRLHLYISDAPCGDASIYEQRRPAVSDGGLGNGGDGDRNLRVSRDACGGGGIGSTASSGGGNGEAGGGRRGDCEDDRGDAKRHRSDDATTGVSDGRPPPSANGPLLWKNDDRKRSSEAVVSHPSGCGGVQQLQNKMGSKAAGKAGVEGGAGAAQIMAFTGAKIIAAFQERGTPDGSCRAEGGEGQGGATATRERVLRIDREQEQQLGALRIKSSRSNISEEGRTMSMSCSDKLAKWAFLGVQGGLLAPWVEPIFLSSIVVSADPRSDGPCPLSSSLSRAIPGRASLALATVARLPTGGASFGGTQSAAAAEAEVRQKSPKPARSPEVLEAMDVFVTDVTFERSKAQSEQRVLEQGAACSSISRVDPADRSPATAPVSPAPAPTVSTPTTADGTGEAAIRHHNLEGCKQGAKTSSMGGSKDTKARGDSNSSNHSNHSNSNKDIGSGSSRRDKSSTSGGGKNARSRRDRKPKKAVPSGTSLNWIEGLGTGRGAGPGGGDAARVQAEVTLSATGRMQGAVSKGVLTLRTRSRLCRARLLEAAELVARAYSPLGLPFLDQDDDRDDDQDDDHYCDQIDAVRSSAEREQRKEAKAQAGVEVSQEEERSDGKGGVGKQGARTAGRRSYWQLKRACDAYRARREAMLVTPTFAAWLVGSKAKQQFAVDAASGVVPLSASSSGR